MSPYPIEPARALGPMRIVVTTYPSREAALAAVDSVLKAKLAVCANVLPAHSRYWWRGALESADEALVLFKTAPKRVGALFRHIELAHPYEVPEVVELDVPRVGGSYLRYLAATLDPSSPPPPLGGGSTRPAAPRAREARAPGRTRARHRLRSR
ncbi:MAG TPA: divalent-cation tolerance protein CutA [Thermoplasmata archaeon]|nr:divalent-cation tolerance protein CutA [Thermoplasmata archaeon]